MKRCVCWKKKGEGYGDGMLLFWVGGDGSVKCELPTAHHPLVGREFEPFSRDNLIFWIYMFLTGLLPHALFFGNFLKS